MIALTMILVRHGSFQPRRVFEFQLPTEPMGQATFDLVAGGKAWRSRVTLRYRDDAQQSFDGADGTVQNYRALTRAEFDFISAHIHESKIRAHEVTPEGDSEPLLLIVHMITGRQKPSIGLRAYAENAVVAMNAAAVRGVIGP
jgi:hypothetical protein